MEECPCVCKCGDGSAKERERVRVTTALSEEIRAAGVPRLLADRTPFVLARDLVFVSGNFIGLKNDKPTHVVNWIGPIFLALSPLNLGKALLEKIPFQAYTISRISVTVKDVVFATKGICMCDTSPLQPNEAIRPVSDYAFYTTTTPPDATEATMRVAFHPAPDVLMEKMRVLYQLSPTTAFIEAGTWDGAKLVARSLADVTTPFYDGGTFSIFGVTTEERGFSGRRVVEEMESSGRTHEALCSTTSAVNVTIDTPEHVTFKRTELTSGISVYEPTPQDVIPTKDNTLRNLTPSEGPTVPCYGLVRVDLPPGLAQMAMIRTLPRSIVSPSNPNEPTKVLTQTEYAAMNCSLTMRVEYAFANALEN